ncbi:lysM and putative peptidoglycan-binding domain-containing protein 2 [Asbolus verrucosus]|uniref:LysM and putative peptidoglycan-binding domain-containing protein 2 n=1 Tax=Asbolus verrucosus TaxID=1661398 RepID=A0A482VEB1_ASBVE|nr:lysM and putative peptidoglycan-binding domain-containing protein 2 [Asbolus verrucosus]
MDRGSYEKLSIRDSARSLKKYGSTSKHVNRNENCIKHYVTNSDTLQGIALKYDVTIEQIRRVNRLWASDSLFLKEFLLIPVRDNCIPPKSTEPTPVVSPTQISSPVSNSSFDDDNVEDFLGKIDASIANTKKEVRKTQTNSEFATNLDYGVEKRKAPVSRMKKTVNNNGSSDLFSPPHTVVVQQGRKVKSSLQQHEQQQDELFEL